MERYAPKGLTRYMERQEYQSKDDFERALQQKGITISRMTSTGNITYEQGGNKARAKSLGAFNRDDVSSLLEKNK